MREAKRIDPEARGIVCAVKARWCDRGNGSADNIRAGGSNSPRKKAEDMTAPTTSATPKITLDQRAPSRHDNAFLTHNDMTSIFRSSL